MTDIAVVFLLVNAIALLVLPRRWAVLPLLAGTLYITLGQGIELGPFNFPVIRLLIAVGVVRVLLRGDLAGFEISGTDKVLLLWALWAMLSSLFYEDTTAVLVNRLGLVYNACGVYFLVRTLCPSIEDVVRLCGIAALLLVPVALVMWVEVQSGLNMFAHFGGVELESEVRNGSVRAQGPFAHSILAGSVGAACLPWMIALWSPHRNTSILGSLACASIVVTSGSSGPLISAALAMVALCVWRWRHRMRIIRWAAVVVYLLLELVMSAPAYYLLARFDFVGGSTGWHRAALIEAALGHLGDWWLAGTDYTRHWIAYGVPWSPNHADITNYYIWMGILGGLPLMFLFIAVLANGFASVTHWLREYQEDDHMPQTAFLVWALGASLFAHAATFISVSYFDQSVVFLYCTLAALSCRPVPRAPRVKTEVDSLPRTHYRDHGSSPDFPPDARPF